MNLQNEAPNAVPGPGAERRGGLITLRSRRTDASGQAIVEFAIVSMAFFMMVFGTIDFGRAIYMYSQLHNAVQEGARIGKTDPVGHTVIENKVIDAASSFDLTAADVTVTCYTSNGSVTTDCATSANVQVVASAQFTAIAQDFLGISPITLKASTRVTTE